MKRNVADQLTALRKRAGISRNNLAARAGYSRGTSLQYYEDPANWTDRRFPLDFVSRIAHALIGVGSPKIEAREVWDLAEPESGVIVARSVVLGIPVLEWLALNRGRSAFKTSTPIGSIEVVGLEPRGYVAVIAPQDYGNGKVPRGSHLILDPDDLELRDGRRYVIMWGGVPMVRLYYSNPARFESDAAPAEPTIYPTGPVEIVARIIRAVIDF